MTDQWQPPNAPGLLAAHPATLAAPTTVPRGRLSPIAIGVSIFVLLLVAGMSFLVGRGTAPTNVAQRPPVSASTTASAASKTLT